MKYGLLVVMVFALAVGCRQTDIRTKTIKVPQMKNDRCARLVVTSLGRTDGVLPDKIVSGDRQVTVTYDSMKVGLRNLEYSISAVGFDAGDTPADAKARAALPAECR